jgi:hypothetical protein
MQVAQNPCDSDSAVSCEPAVRHSVIMVGYAHSIGMKV